MKKNNIMIGVFVFILIFISNLFLEKVEAKEILNPEVYFGIVELRESGMGYAMGNPSTGAERIWNIVQYSDTSFTNFEEANVYCIKADTGFSNATKTDIYDVTYNMKEEKGAIAEQNDILKGLIEDGQYDNLLALGDLLYVPGVSTQSEKEQLLEKSGVMDILRNEYLEDMEEFYITDDEIEAVQQAAVWYFTNYGQADYDKYGKTSWLWYTENGEDYKTLSSYNTPIGEIRKDQVEVLYDYLIDTAKSNASKGINDEKTILTVYASNDNALAQPIMEVTKLPKEFDLSLRKYITAVNDKTVANSRVPVIDESTLENGTTATYNHRKDPVEVKLNDTITYNITVYNEGELAGRATEIVDQLPTGLEFVEVVSGNFEKSTYNTQNNTLYLTRKSSNTENLPAYTEGTLSAETIQIKCKVTETGGETDKILTNIAWIAEEIDENGNVITSTVGEDRDSEPSTITSKTKDQLVTTDNGYIGNNNNTGKDLTNNQAYFEGQQDDDDFEKVVVRAVTSIDVSKIWNDSGNQDGLRTDTVTVELLIDGQATGKTITLKADEWSGTFENLPTKIDGKDVTYSVKETTSISGYTTNTSSIDSTGKSFTITNTHKIFDLSLRKYITKVGNTDITDRIPSINTNSLSTGTTATYNHRKDPVVVETGDMVIYNLTIYNEGEKAGRATKIEDQLPAGLKYVEVVSGNFELDSYSETDNLLKLKRTSNTDNLSAYEGGATLDSETIQIKCEVTANAGSEDSILTNVAWISEAYDAEDNKTITTEKKADTDSEPATKPTESKTDLVTTDEGYIGNNSNSGKDLTNNQEYFEGEQDDDDFEKIVVEARTQVTATKQWVDNDNQDGKRPTQITFQLYKQVGSGTATLVTSQEVTGTENEWTTTFTNLPVYENGQQIIYTVREVNENGNLDDYTSSGEGTANNNYTITNSYTPEKTQIVVTKNWEDNNDQDRKRPGEITLTLYAGDVAKENTPSVSKEGNTWTYTFNNLPKYENGEEIVYTVRETVPDGYTASDEGIANSANNYTITNSYTPEMTQIVVTKNWEDNNDQDRKRPGEITLTLYAGDVAKENTPSVSKEGNTWTYTFNNLPKYENGEEIVYTVRETVPDGYTASDEGIANSANHYTITNSYTPEVTSVNVNKVWNDNDNQDGIRPEEIIVELLKNEQETGNRVTLNAENNWTDTFVNLPVYEDGEKITYTVKEITVNGYAVNIAQNSENNFTITNTHTPGTTSVTVNKVWDDKDNQDGLRPDSIQVQLIGTIEDENGESITVVNETMPITEENGWIGTFNDLPVKEDGKEIIYTVREITQIEGYTTEITETTASTDETETTTEAYAAKSMVRATTANVEPKSFSITNTHVVEEEFDLALRKFIAAVSKDETIEESDILMNADGTAYEREPVVDASKLNTTDENGNIITTATYNHTKKPVLVEKNDIVVYMLRVYNEGEQDGYAAEITDYLPPYLEFVNGEFNEQYGWEVSEDGRTVTTRYLENSIIAKPQTDASGNNTLSYVQVPIMCRVSDNVNANENVTNIADITEYEDANKEPVEDRDSEEHNVELPDDENLPGYKDDEIDKDYVPGQEDDDDFEKVYVQDFDLALRKFISEVDGTAYNREPNVDLSGLENGTTAIYNHTKEPVLVKRNSVIIYTIRVYNEGEIDGYAERITDYLPEGLEYLPEHEINKEYEWTVSEDGREVTTDYLSSAKETTERENIIQAYDGKRLDYKEVQIACRVKEEAETNVKLTNLAEITEDSDEDRDSTPDNVEIPNDEELPGYKDDEINQDYVPGQEDDDDFEKVIIQEFDLALRKFITKVDDEDVTNRIPEVSYDREEDEITYNHTKEPVEVVTGNVVEYTIRVYNEGDIAGYAEEVADDIPDGLRYLPENATNIEYRWVMYDAEGNETENVEEAVEIRTDYLSKEQEETEGENLLQAFNPEEEIGEGNPDYRDIKVAFEVIEPNSSDRIIINSAQITEDSDENGNPVEDKDSIPDEWNEGEDDQDKEYIKLTYFDLALRKWVTEAIVIENGQETVTQTGHTAEMDPEPVVKVELYRKDINDVIVKFRYKIRVTNEGDIAGYAKEITDYVPEGLRFVAEDNPGWTDEGNNVISTRLLENTLLQPGESAEVEVVLTWINSEDNMGQMTNTAEISEDYNDKGVPDRDSTPDNQVPGEDDIDDAPVLLSIETGQQRIYFVLGLTTLGVLAGGLVFIKKFVI